ncbi:MAG: NAD(P)-dependent glycerol-3-phosphate dehydrogenase [Deltaproteobacteria bacterium]|nr:MAG: NAD(P)-dependent glycerol-3-phosphate dehydrogenase [Deltaproteobacteria bacterium]
MSMRCTVLGAGSWGTALAIHLVRRGHEVVIWDRNPERCVHIDEQRRNPRYLRDVPLPAGLRAEPDLNKAAYRAELLVPVVPSHALRDVMDPIASTLQPGASVCCATKGIEEGTGATMPEVLKDLLSPEHASTVSLLYGPSFAAELALGLPTAIVCAGPPHAARPATEAFHGDNLRVYSSDDLVGVAIGGSLKNVMAIACGVSDGAGLGANARAALITRGLAEITRLAVALGANPLTMAGLAGMGDLVLTCTGSLSRNRRVGLALGEGRSLDDILGELGEVAEGVVTARSARALGRKVGIEMPITEQVYAMLYEGRPAARALTELMGRDRKEELQGLQ